MHNTLVFATFPLHSSVFYHSTERFVKFGAVLHHDLSFLSVKLFDTQESYNNHWARRYIWTLYRLKQIMICKSVLVQPVDIE